MADRESYLYQAKLAEQAERYDEMVQAMKNLAKLNTELTVEERNLLSVGYKNVIGTRRASWRVINAIESKEKEATEVNTVKMEVIKKYRQKIEAELTEICEDILKLLTDTLISTCTKDDTETNEAKVFYYKMKGDYYRYMAEFQHEGEQRKKCAEQSLEAYKSASAVGKDGLSSTHPIRLGLALNFSVFYYEILNDAPKAINLAKTAFDDAVSDLNGLTDESYKDSTLILQLLRDNLTLWTSEIGEDEEEKAGPVEDVEAQ